MNLRMLLSILWVAMAVPAAALLFTNTRNHDMLAERTSRRIKGEYSQFPRALYPISSCSETNTRVEWGDMPDSDRREFVAAIKCLMVKPPKGSSNATSRYDELVWVHQQMQPVVHSNGFFLPWHRYFLFTFETMLRNECNYKAPLPWWYEINDAGNYGGSDLFTHQYFGSLPEEPNKDPDELDVGVCIKDGVSRTSQKPNEPYTANINQPAGC